MASRRTRSFGAASLAELVSCARASGIRISEQQAHEAVTRHFDVEFFDGDWFFLPLAGYNRLCTLSRRILAVASPLDVSGIRAGVCRTFTPRRLVSVPPLSVMTAFYRAHPAFAIDVQCRVRPLRELDYRVELDPCDQLFVDVFRSSWIGVLDRESFHDACVVRGMKTRTFTARTNRSAVLDEAPGDIWFLRGTRVSPITAAALRYAKGEAGRRVALGD
jgi:hypothetical protein